MSSPKIPARYNYPMADFSLKIKAEDLGKVFEGIGEQLEAELSQAVSDLAQAAHAKIIADIQSEVSSDEFRQELLKSVDMLEIGPSSYLITLDGSWANKLEEGYDGYDMKQSLLNSTKTVGVGKRAGQSWVQKNQETDAKFAHVPISKQPSRKAGKDLSGDIDKITAVNMQNRRQKITKIFKDAHGKPLSGAVAQGRSDNPELDKITKYQKVSPKGSVSSHYITYRTISETSSGWQHPGHDGYHFFKAAEEFVEAELENIIETLL